MFHVQLLNLICENLYFCDTKRLILAFRNGFAPVKIFYDIPSLLFSAAAELRALIPNLCHVISVPMIARNSIL
jgi:hypothetical protein